MRTHTPISFVFSWLLIPTCFRGFSICCAFLADEVVFLTQPGLVNSVSFDLPKVENCLLDRVPFLGRQPCNPSQFAIIIWQRAVVLTPCSEQQQEVGSMLLGREVRGVSQIGVSEEWDRCGRAHKCSPLTNPSMATAPKTPPIGVPMIYQSSKPSGGAGRSKQAQNSRRSTEFICDSGRPHNASGIAG